MRFLFAFLLSLLAAAASAYAQDTAVLQGRLVTSLSGDPIAAATVVLDELKRETVSGADGTFRFENLAPGTYHVFIRAAGYSSRRTEVTVTAMPGTPSISLSIPIFISGKSHRSPRRRGASSTWPSPRPCSRGRSSPNKLKAPSVRRSRTSPASLRAASGRRHRGPSFEASTAIAFSFCRTASEQAICPASRAITASR